MILAIDTPRVFLPLLAPSRYKGAHGGRGSGKSHFFAELLVEQAILRPGLRAVCVREVQNDLKESVKRLIEDKIEALGVGSLFDVQRDQIITPGGGIIIFKGMQTYNAESIKSLEGYRIAWVEEAQSLSARSLEMLRPTMFRTDDSEIWFSWNPSKDSDPVDKLLRGPNPPPKASVVEVNYADNPWFPASLREEMEYDRGNDLDRFSHVWLGKYRTISEALIFKGRVRIEAFETPPLNLIDRFYYGVDWGFAADPTAIVRCFIQDECLYIDHEAFGHGVEIDETDQLFDKVPGARTWPLKADCSRPETISYMARHGFDITAAAKWSGSVEDGVTYLKGFRQIVIHERCRNIAEEFRLYSYRVDPKQVDASGQPVILPIIIDKWNHGIDALRYALDGYIAQGSFDLATYIKAYG